MPIPLFFSCTFSFFLSLSHFSTFSYPLFSFYPFVFSFLYFSSFFSFFFPSCFFLSFPILLSFSRSLSLSLPILVPSLFFYFTSFLFILPFLFLCNVSYMEKIKKSKKEWHMAAKPFSSSLFLFHLPFSSFSSQLCFFLSSPFSFPFFRHFQFLCRFLHSFFSSLSLLILFPYLRDTITVQLYNLFCFLRMTSERRSFTILVLYINQTFKWKNRL